MIAYADVVPIGTGLIIGASCFGLGAIYSGLPYNAQTLFHHDTTGQAFERSLAHYVQWYNAPAYVHYILHGVISLGLTGCLVKIYKCDPEAAYFEYGTLGLLVLAVIIYLTNLRTGLYSCIYGNWGEVDMPTGINVMAASEVMIVVVLLGVLTLQAGLYYANWYDAKLKAEFLRNEAQAAKRQQAAAETGAPAAAEPKTAAKATGAQKTATKQAAKKPASKKKA